MRQLEQKYGWIFLMLVATGAALAVLLSNATIDESLLKRWNGVSLADVTMIYAVLLIGLCAALPFAARLSALLQRFQIGILILSAVTCFLVVHLLEPNQEHRLFTTPFSVWVIIVHSISLCVILAWTAIKSAPLEGRFHRLVVILLIGMVLVLIGLHIVSLGEFMDLDIPDEPAYTSMATNYAQNGDLSPNFLGSPFGSPDPVFPRYYLLMGLIIKVAGSSLAALRLLPLLVGFLAMALVAYILWIDGSLTTAQRLVGVIAMLSVNVFVRMSHNLRSDIGLALYGAIILLGLIRYFSRASLSWRWVAAMGVALYVGLEAIPFMAVFLAAIVGMAFIVNALREASWRTAAKTSAIYALGCTLSLAVYGAMHFLPDIPSAIAGFQKFNSYYNPLNPIGTFHNPVPGVINYHLQFSLILSPIEIWVTAAALGLLWWKGSPADRWILAVFGLTACLMLMFTHSAYGYWALFTPLVAYAAAKALTSKRLVLLGTFVLIPALASPPIYDLSQAAISRSNQTRLQQISRLTPLVPEGAVVIADDLFWFTIHENRTVIGLTGFMAYAAINHIDLGQAAINLKASVLLCNQSDKLCDQINAAGLFGDAQRVPVGDTTYLIYRRP